MLSCIHNERNANKNYRTCHLSPITWAELQKRDGELRISKIFMREIGIIDQNCKHAVFDLQFHL